MNEIKKYLPVGSIVIAKEGTKELMIVGYGIKINDKIYDYFAVPYPEGFIDKDNVFSFNEEDIDKVEVVGYKDEHYSKMNEELNKLLNK